jgi:hypothetical protein
LQKRPDQLERLHEAFSRGEKGELERILDRVSYNAPIDATPLALVKQYDCAGGGVMSALVRPFQWGRALAHPQMSVFFLVRTDVMRITISLAKELTTKCPHPQFGKCSDSDRQKHLSLRELRRVVDRKITRSWREKAQAALAIVRGEDYSPGRPVDCSRVHFVTYESFLDSPREVAATMWTHVQRVSRGSAKARSTPPQALNFSKVHSSQISSFVSNSEEVFLMFAWAKLPTFRDMLEEVGFLKICPKAHPQ